MKVCIFTLIFMLGVTGLFAERFSLGKAGEVFVPAPAGYVRLTEQMGETYTLLYTNANRAGNLLSVYIPEEAAKKALRGELPDIEQYFLLQKGTLTKPPTSRKDFAQVRSGLANNREQIEKASKEKILLRDGAPQATVYKVADTEFAVTHDGLQLEEAHHNSEDAIAYSQTFTNIFTSGGQSFKINNAVTTTLINVSGHVLVLQARSETADIAWTRSASLQWQEEILHANRPPAQITPPSDTQNLITLLTSIAASLWVSISSACNANAGCETAIYSDKRGFENYTLG